MGEMKEIIRESKAALCLACGRCTTACPLSTPSASLRGGNDGHSPRVFVERLLTYNEIDRVNLWECLTCERCTVFCPSSVKFSEFIRSLRSNFQTEAFEKCAHAGILHSLMRLMAYNDLDQNRLDWITSDFEVSKEVDTLLFVGCAPYYDIYFDRWSPLETTKRAVKLLNLIGIKPVLLNDEVCCGHDLLWTGDQDAFNELERKNNERILKSNPKRIVFTCPECYSTFKNDYKLGKWIQLLHLTELLIENLDKLNFKETRKKVSYHDSCRMGRFQGLYDAPRKLLEAIPGIELREFAETRERALCCGTSCWMSCNSRAKRAQLQRLNEAKEISETLVTPCPKCLIHYSCTMDEKEKNPIVEVEDIIVTVANSLEI